MISIFIVFTIMVVVFIFPSQLSEQKNSLEEVKKSLDVRLMQLKRDFQFRTKELARRLKNADLAQEEWQSLTDELAEETKSSISSTELANASAKINRLKSIPAFLMITAIVISAVSYYYSGFYEKYKHQDKLITQLINDPKTLERFTLKVEEKKSESSLDDLYALLRKRVDLYPSNTDAWRELASFNARFGRLEEAEESYKAAIKLNDSDQQLKIDFAQQLLQSKKREDIFLSLEIINGVLQVEPEHQSALFLLGDIYYQFGFNDKAVSTWTRLLNTYDANSEMAKLLTQRLDNIKNLKQETAVKNQAINQVGSEVKNNDQSKKKEQKNSVDSKSQITVKIQISKDILSQLNGNETVFIFAKAVNGPRFPVAVVRTSLTELPSEIILTDANAMQASHALSKYDQVKVVVRISKSGNAITQQGDIESSSEVLQAPFSNEVLINIK